MVFSERENPQKTNKKLWTNSMDFVNINKSILLKRKGILSTFHLFSYQ